MSIYIYRSRRIRYIEEVRGGLIKKLAKKRKCTKLPSLTVDVNGPIVLYFRRLVHIIMYISSYGV